MDPLICIDDVSSCLVPGYTKIGAAFNKAAPFLLFVCGNYTSSMTAISAASPLRVPMRVMRV